MPTRFLTRIHTSRGLRDQLRSLIMFIKNQDEILGRLAVAFAELVNPLDGFPKDRLVESVRVMGTWRLGLPDPDIEDEAVERRDPVEQAVRELPEFRVSGDIRNRVEAGPFLFPLGRVLLGPIDLECEKLALTLEEPHPETAHLSRGQDEARQSENRAVVVSGVFPADVRSDVAEFVEVGEVGQ